jgi:ribosome maturation factor RimP
MNAVPTDHTSRIKALADQAAKGGPSYVVDVEVKGGAGTPIIWVYIDAEVGQATIDDCTRISRELSLLMDAHELYADGNYTLNVSTPGLSRPLTDMRQYRNNLGRNARVKTRADDKTNIFEGKLQSFDDDGLVLDTKKGIIELKFADIIETKILPAW